MKRSFFIFFLFFFIYSSNIYAQSYEKMWNNISESQKRGLPQSVVDQAYKIFQKACKEKNSPQIVKSFLTAMQYREEISPDSLNVDIVSLEKLARESQMIDERSLLYSILARISSISKPDNAVIYVRMAMNDAPKMSEQSYDRYKSIINSGKISEKYFKNNLLHIIANINLNTLKKIDNSSWSKKPQFIYNKINTISDFESKDIIPISENDCRAEYLKIYQTLLREYKSVGLMDAWIISASDLLNELKFYANNYNDVDASQNMMRLIDDYSKYESAAYPYSLLVEKRCAKQDYVEVLDMIKKVLTKYPNYVSLEYFKDREKEILSSSLSASTYNLYVGVDSKLRVTYRNTPYLKMNLYSVDNSISPLELYNDADKRYAITLKDTLVKSKLYNLAKYDDYKYHNEEIDISIDNPGVYYLELEDVAGNKEGKIISVTSFLPIIQALPGGKTKILILDALKGKPVKDAQFNIYNEEDGNYRKLELSEIIKSDSNGVVFIDSNRKVSRYNITKGEDKAMELTHFRADIYKSFTDYKKERVSIFTDRSIYKPGQIVNFSGFAYTIVDDSTKVLPHKEYEVTLVDANHTPISTLNITTDNFGAFNGQFTLPNASLNGRYCIKIISCETAFMVEEYKRPSFHVDFMPIEDTFSIGDTINVIGYAKSLWGMPLKNVQVRYKVNRFAPYKGGGEEIEEKEIRSDEKGCFVMPVIITEQENNLPRYWYKQYTLSAIVTDDSGESVENSISIPYGSSSLIIDCEGLNDIVLKEDNDTIIYRVKNMFGQSFESKPLLKLYRLENERRDSTLILERFEEANKSVPMSWIESIPSGRYRLVLQCSDNKNREAEFSKEFTLFSINDKRPPVKNDFWIYDGDKKRDLLSFGTSKKDADIYFAILAKDKIIEDRVYTISDSIISVDCSYKKEYGDGAEMTIAFVKDGKVYSYSKKIIKPFPIKKLVLKWETFRDKLQPGKREEWKLKISYPDGKAANAQLMSTMYDASLDEIYKDGWKLDLYYTRDVNSYPYSFFQGESCFINLLESLSLNRDATREYSLFDIPYLNSLDNFYYPALLNNEVVTLNSPSLSVRDNSVTAKKQRQSKVGNEQNITVRKDFSETAFFYPQQHSDRNGVIKIAFSLPESLTKWHFIGFAHTEDVNFGFIEADIVSFKEFMVKPDLPRFMRCGDRCIIPVSVTNLKKSDVSGELYFEMIDPINNKVIYTSSKKFEVKDGRSKIYEFEYLVPDNYSILICRIVGRGKRFSDGEQNIIPILSDKEMVTESVPMIMTNAGKYNYKIASSKEKKVTLEVTANPIWHVVQALPSMLNQNGNDAYSWASVLYASFVNEYIINNNPAIHNLSSIYKSAPYLASKEMLESELQKNNDLKEIILSETPWVAQANNEESQRKLFSQIADVNYINYNRQLAVEHLMNLQNMDGSWSWYNGMVGNISVTADILESLLRIKSMVGSNFNDNINRMILSSFNFLKDEVENYYKKDKEENNLVNEENALPQFLVKYLYICTLDPSLKFNEEINSYYIEKLKVSASSLDIYQKSLSAVIFHKSGFRDQTNQFIESLIQYTVYSKELGRYFDTRRAKYTYSSNIIPSVVSTIEALNLAGDKEKYISEMKQWLIAMKGVQSWSTNISTVNAIYALLANEELTSDDSRNGYIKISTGSESFKINRNEPIGYLKREISNSVNNLSLEKTYPGISYGAVYIQGLEKVDTLRSSSTALSIKKYLYRGDEMIDDKTILNIGDVVRVHLVIESPIYMDFVQIKDPLYSCMQPRQQLSTILGQGDIEYNKQVKNASINLFIDKLRKGVHTIDYDVYITKRGSYKSGLTTAESAYFPMLRSFASSQTVNVE